MSNIPCIYPATVKNLWLPRTRANRFLAVVYAVEGTGS